MRQVREVLRFKLLGGIATRAIARRIGVAPSTVRAMLKRFEASGLSWPLPAEMTDVELDGSCRLSVPFWDDLRRLLLRQRYSAAKRRS
jgi:transposase-like protein